MSRFQTVIEPRVLPRKREKLPFYIEAIIDFINLSYNVLLPFICGILLATTNNKWFVFIIIIIALFNIKVEYLNEKIKIRVNK